MIRLTIILFLLTGANASAQKLPYINQTEAGLLLGEGIKPSFSIQTFNGVKINNGKLEAGLTTGLDVYQPATILPVMAGLKYRLFKVAFIQSYLNINAGYGFWLKDREDGREYKGGYSINPSLGLRFISSRKTRLNFSVGYKEQKASVLQNPQIQNDFPGQGWVSTDEFTFKRISLTTGFSF